MTRLADEAPETRETRPPGDVPHVVSGRRPCMPEQSAATIVDGRHDGSRMLAHHSGTIIRRMAGDHNGGVTA